jgi:hypothetical protein
MTDEPKKWGFTKGKWDSHTLSPAAGIAYSYDEDAWPKVHGHIRQQGINAAGHPWFYISLGVYAVKNHQVFRLSSKTPPGRDYGYPQEETRDAIVEFANATQARVCFISTFYTTADAHPVSHFMYDWIVVDIEPQRNKNLAVGRAVFEAIKEWHRRPIKSGDLIEKDLFYDPLKAYDTGFYGVDP